MREPGRGRAGPGGSPGQLARPATAFTAQGYAMACHVHGDVTFDAVPVERYERFREEAAVPATRLGGRPTWAA
ncbi:hypothetical protein ACIQZB_04190 [Streptomyces sp. NPDC097727]|uniref:hypothetical protein n=1 Tax=Streptomyces sp. NPDC097727 TaxID=3366092 RepID=UPI00382120F2